MKRICLLLLLAAALSTAACGKKGDLTLPPSSMQGEVVRQALHTA